MAFPSPSFPFLRLHLRQRGEHRGALPPAPEPCGMQLPDGQGGALRGSLGRFLGGFLSVSPLPEQLRVPWPRRPVPPGAAPSGGACHRPRSQQPLQTPTMKFAKFFRFRRHFRVDSEVRREGGQGVRGRGAAGGAPAPPFLLLPATARSPPSLDGSAWWGGGHSGEGGDRGALAAGRSGGGQRAETGGGFATTGCCPPSLPPPMWHRGPRHFEAGGGGKKLFIYFF